MSIKHLYFFGGKQSEGDATMRNLLGGKGANLAEMSKLGIPVPPGFTITTQACNKYFEIGEEKLYGLIEPEIKENLSRIEDIMGAKFGDPGNPLLLSVRSGARVSMPGMMDTVLNLGLNDTIVEGLGKRFDNIRFAWDSYRRFIQMYGDVVMGLKPEDKDDIDPFEELIGKLKAGKNYSSDADFTTDDLRHLVRKFKELILEKTGRVFPEDPMTQLRGAIMAVFDSWHNERAEYYRKINGIPSGWGTAVNVQAMVFGNMGNNSATGVAFTRDAATGENIFNGEYLINAQGEDVVAGVRTPQQITLEGSRRWAKLSGISEEERAKHYPSLEETMPGAFAELFDTQRRLERHYRDMQDLEFTIQEGRLWLLQTRTGKRTGAAMVKIAVDMWHEGIIDEREVLGRIDPVKINELLHPVFEAESLHKATVIATGLPASPGAATGKVVFFADEAEQKKAAGEEVILVRIETSPEDLAGMDAANGILTARGGMTSHAAVVARGMGKTCIAGAGSLHIDYKQRTFSVGERTFSEGDWISLDGSTGRIYEGKIATVQPSLEGEFEELMKLAEKHAGLYVRANADTPKDAATARKFGARGIGLCRTEHMFFEGEKILAMREMILSDDEKGRRAALDKLLPMQRSDFEGIFEAMQGYPVTVRLLDPPLHEFIPHDEKGQREMAEVMGVPVAQIRQKVEDLSEFNPMLGHRGCRLGNTFPEITEMQTRAIIEAALNLKKRGITAVPEIMVPLVGNEREMKMQEQIIRSVINKVFEEYGDSIPYKVGTMIEIPRAALTADEIAKTAEFFSFGTNDLTQMTFGYSRDDAGKFLPVYLKKGILDADPFETIDQQGVGQLVEMAVRKGRQTRPDLSIGICGEHGGDPDSIDFFHRAGLHYVSCSPYRVPIAWIATAQARITHG